MLEHTSYGMERERETFIYLTYGLRPHLRTYVRRTTAAAAAVTAAKHVLCTIVRSVPNERRRMDGMLQS